MHCSQVLTAWIKSLFSKRWIAGGLAIDLFELVLLLACVMKT